MITCANTWCGTQFETSKDDLVLLEKLSPMIGGKVAALPPYTLCFPCRLQRRMAFYNGRRLYRRRCDFTKEPIVSLYSPDKPFTVYRKDVWFSDKWDPLSHGRDFDFSRPFFPQFYELMRQVPLQALNMLGDQDINSEYTNDNYKLKNCYLIFDGEQAESCFYGQAFLDVRDCSDFLDLEYCELCHECVECHKCYNLKQSRYCSNCSDSWFLRDCAGCRHCFGCANLHQKEYCLFNEQVSKTEFEKFLQAFESTSHSATEEMRKRAEGHFLRYPLKAVRGVQNIETVGDNLNNSKNAYWCFDSNNLHDARYCTRIDLGAKDSADVHVWGNAMEKCYNSSVIGARVQNVIAGHYVIEGASDVFYSMYCSRTVSNLLGCIGLQHRHHCIFNKQYSEQEYDALALRIVEHMQRTGEWGEFFPPENSAFGYNETRAMEHFPMTREQVLKNGWQWSEYEQPVEAKKSVPGARLPDRTEDIPDDILNWAVECETSGVPFKIVSQELAMLRERKLPIPRKHPDQRHRDRLQYKNPFYLWNRSCAKCKKDVQTSNSPQRPEVIFCEECYMKEVY